MQSTRPDLGELSPSPPVFYLLADLLIAARMVIVGNESNKNHIGIMGLRARQGDFLPVGMGFVLSDCQRP